MENSCECCGVSKESVIHSVLEYIFKNILDGHL